MLFRFAADLVLLLHLGCILFGLFGGLLTLWWRRAALAHLPLATWIALVALQGWICPLTPLENRLRRMAGEEGYRGGFLDHYLLPLVYPEGLTGETQFLLGVVAIVLNLAIYLPVILVLYRRRRS